MRFLIASVVVLQTALLALVWVYVPPVLPPIPAPVVLAACILALWVLLTRQDGYRYRPLVTLLGVMPVEGIAFAVGAIWTYACITVWLRFGFTTVLWFYSAPTLFMTLSSVVVLGWCVRRALVAEASDTRTEHQRFRIPLARTFAPGRLVVLFVCLATLAAALPLKRYLDGYCYAQDRFVPDDELIQNALVYRAKFVKGLPVDPTREDLRTYVRQHPDCCTVMGPDFFLASSFRARLLGYSRTWVRIIHPLTDKERAKLGDPFAISDVYIKLDRCGKAISKTGQHHAAR